MKTRLSSVLGLALLAASLAFTSSFACSNRADEQTSIVNAPPAEIAQSAVAEVTQPRVAEAVEPTVAEPLVVETAEPAVAEPPVTVAEAAELPVAEATPPLAAVGESDPSTTEEASPPAIYALDAIHAEVTQTVTIAAQGQNEEDDQPAYIGSIGEEGPPPAVKSDEATVADGTQNVSVVVPLESADEEQTVYTGSIAAEVARSTTEAPAAQPDSLPGEDAEDLDRNEP